jgi:hypothetical protein
MWVEAGERIIDHSEVARHGRTGQLPTTDSLVPDETDCNDSYVGTLNILEPNTA